MRSSVPRRIAFQEGSTFRDDLGKNVDTSAPILLLPLVV
jgi:hypothetical protein